MLHGRTISWQIATLYAYIIGHYNPSVRIINIVSYTTYVVCVNLYISGGTYSFKSTPNDRFFERIFHGNFIYSKSLCQKSAEREIAEEMFFLYTT